MGNIQGDTYYMSHLGKTLLNLCCEVSENLYLICMIKVKQASLINFDWSEKFDGMDYHFLKSSWIPADLLHLDSSCDVYSKAIAEVNRMKSKPFILSPAGIVLL